jgi:CheY-like chemotaxis protein
VPARESYIAKDVLIVEDSAADARLILEAFQDSDLVARCWVVGDGAKALAFLQQGGEYTDAPRPDLIILDINLPGRTGTEVLAQIKGSPSLRQIPVTVFTSSSAEKDIEAAYSLHANCFVTKPIELEDFLKDVEMIGEFWLRTVRLPGA